MLELPSTAPSPSSQESIAPEATLQELPALSNATGTASDEATPVQDSAAPTSSQDSSAPQLSVQHLPSLSNVADSALDQPLPMQDQAASTVMQPAETPQPGSGNAAFESVMPAEQDVDISLHSAASDTSFVSSNNAGADGEQPEEAAIVKPTGMHGPSQQEVPDLQSSASHLLQAALASSAAEQLDELPEMQPPAMSGLSKEFAACQGSASQLLQAAAASSAG